MITVTKGQWFPITISNIQYGGADFDLQGATDVKAALISSLGTRAELSFEVTAYNELSAVSEFQFHKGAIKTARLSLARGNQRIGRGTHVAAAVAALSETVR